MRFIKQLCLSILSLTVFVHAGDPPKVLGDYMQKDKEIRAEVVQMTIPKEFLQFDKIVAKLRMTEPEWFAEHMKKAAPGDPIPPYDAKFGITKEEYDKYIKLWQSREFKKVANGDLRLMLKESSDGNWVINANGLGMPISLLSFNPKTGNFKSTNGEMKRIADINSPAVSEFGAWTGHEWKYLHKGQLSVSKENLAIGLTGDKKYGILIYSLQEMSRQGVLVEDKLLMIRFVPKKAK